jgi:PAS domain S-box-containing protein
MITGDATVESAVRALRKGAYDYLKKPFEPEELLKTVDNALHQRMLRYKNQVLNSRLSLSERRFRFLLKTTPDMIYTLDPTGRFKYINSGAQKLFGYRPADLVGKHYKTVLYSDDITNAQWRFNERRTGSRATSGFELRLKPGPLRKGKRANGNYAVVELNSTGVYRSGGDNNIHIGTYGIVRDMTRRRSLEKNIRQARNVDTLNKLAGCIALDLNNLLSATQVMASVVSHRMPSDTPYVEQIKTIEQYIQSSSDLAHQLFYLAKGEKLEIQNIGVNSLSRKVTLRLKATDAKEVNVAGDFNKWDCETHPMVKDDEGRWKTTLRLPPGRYEFKFLVDGHWRECSENELTAQNEFGTMNNVLVVSAT